MKSPDDDRGGLETETPHTEPRRARLPIFLLILGCAFAGSEAGMWSLPLGRLLGTGFCLGGIVLLVGRPRPDFRNWAFWAGTLGTLLVVVALYAGGQRPVHDVLALAALAILLPPALRTDDGSRRASVAPVLLAASWLYLRIQGHPHGFWLVDHAADWLSGRMTVLVEPPPSLGEAYFPFLPAILLTVVAVYGARPTWGSRLLRGGLALAGGTLLLALYVNGFALLPEFDTPYPRRSFFPSSLDWDAVLRTGVFTIPPFAVAFSTALLSLAWGWRPRPAAANLGGRKVLLGAAAAAVLGGFLLHAGQPSFENLQGARVTFFKPGYVNWAKPDPGTYGAFSIGMLGQFPDLAQRLGAEPRMVSAVSEKVLSETDLLVFVNHEKALDAEDYERVGRYVQKGGALLVVGDHTFRREGIGISPNLLLNGTHIRFRFDTANSFIGGWLHSYRLLAAGIDPGIPMDRNHIGLVTGASLEVAPPARAVVIGQYGFSDLGDLSAKRNGYLGDMRYNDGERLGDLALLAVERVGDGRVMVVGDTTCFSNPLLPHSHEFVSRCLAWLLDDRRSLGEAFPFFLVGALALVLGCGVLVRREDLWPRWILAALLLLGLLTVGGRSAGIGAPYSGDLAFLDTSHVPNVAEEGGMNVGAAGIMRGFVRNGFLPLKTRCFAPEEMPDGSVLALLTPKRSLSDSDAERILSFARRGGLVLVTAGMDERDAVAPLLDRIGVRIVNMPLGAISVEVFEGIRPVAFRTAFPIQILKEEVKIVVRSGRYPLIIERDFGRGRIVVAGDPRFFLNQNLETSGSFLVGNVALLKKLLDRHRRERR